MDTMTFIDDRKPFYVRFKILRIPNIMTNTQDNTKHDTKIRLTKQMGCIGK